MDEATQRRLAELRSACGCKSGSAAMLLAVIAYASYALWLDPESVSLGMRFLSGFGAALLGMGIGKILGIGWARHQYRQLLRSMGQAHPGEA